MSTARAWRRRIKRLAARLGAESELERVYQRFTPTPWTTRRDRRDNEHLRLLLAFSLSADSCCIDVGCHKGAVLSEMVRLAPQGRHIAYEPVPALCADLRRKFPQVDVREAALSNGNGETSFTVVTSAPAYSGIRERDYPGEQALKRITVRTESLDSALPDNFVPRLIKVDVEGAERLVFEGAIETLKRYQPIVFFEHGVGASDHYGTRPGHVYELLVREAGLRIFDADGNGPYSETGFQRIFEGPMWNFCAHA